MTTQEIIAINNLQRTLFLLQLGDCTEYHGITRLLAALCE